MKKYAVSIVWALHNSDGINIHNSLRVLEAINESEAFGLTYDDCVEIRKTHQMSFKTIVEIVL